MLLSTLPLSVRYRTHRIDAGARRQNGWSTSSTEMGDAYLIERVRRNAAGRITHVCWVPRSPPSVCVDVDVAVVLAALRDGTQVHVMVGLIIGQRVQESADGTTIIDHTDGPPQVFRLGDMPLF